MKKPLFIVILLLYFSAVTSAQTLNWGTSFLTSLLTGFTNGTANNISGSGVDCNVNINLSGGSYTYANGIFGSMSPTVSGATAHVPGSANRAQIGVNFSNKSSTNTVTYTFSTLVTNVTFRIVDIDRLTAYSYNYVDKVTITGNNGTSTVNPTITRYDATTDPNFLVISGNSAWANPTFGESGNSSSDNTDQRGTITVSFGAAAVNSVTIIYGNEASSQNNPGSQFIAIGNMSFSPITLPVLFLNFEGNQSGNDVMLKWSTAQEINSDRFIVERSDNGNNWRQIGSVTAVGNTTSKTDYNFKDVNPPATTLLYRLKQIDLDAKFDYSSVVRIVNKKITYEMSVYPNPVTSQVNISFSSSTEQRITATVYDMNGRLIKTKEYRASSGSNNFMLSDFEKIAKGVYTIDLTDEHNSSLGVSRFIKD